MGKDITNLAPYDICKLGISRTFQVVKPFEPEQFFTNVMVGAFNQTSSSKVAREISEKHIEDLGCKKEHGSK